MLALIRRALRRQRYRMRWRALAASAERSADRATALHEREAIVRRTGLQPPRRRRFPF
jgi:hypothetical protein